MTFEGLGFNERGVVLEEREERRPVVCREERTTARLVDAGSLGESEKRVDAGRRSGRGLCLRRPRGNGKA